MYASVDLHNNRPASEVAAAHSHFCGPRGAGVHLEDHDSEDVDRWMGGTSRLLWRRIRHRGQVVEADATLSDRRPPNRSRPAASPCRRSGSRRSSCIAAWNSNRASYGSCASAMSWITLRTSWMASMRTTPRCLAFSRHASCCAVLNSQPCHSRSRSGWQRRNCSHAKLQASSMSSRDAVTFSATVFSSWSACAAKSQASSPRRRSGGRRPSACVRRLRCTGGGRSVALAGRAAAVELDRALAVEVHRRPVALEGGEHQVSVSRPSGNLSLQALPCLTPHRTT